MGNGSTFLLMLCLVFAILQRPMNCVCRRAEYLSVSGECCPMCGKGLVVRKDCTEDSSTSCIPCLQGTYMDEPNGYDKCRKCTYCDPGQGLYTLHECSTTDDAICDVLDNYFCVDSSSSVGCSFAEKHSVCLAGEKIKTPGSKISDTECENCPFGQYSKYGVNCTAWTDCDAIGKQKDKEGSATSDVTCRDLPRQHYVLILSVLLFLFPCGLSIFCWIRQQRKHFIPVEEYNKQGERSEVQELQIPVGSDERDHLKYPTQESTAVSTNIPEESEVEPEVVPSEDTGEKETTSAEVNLLTAH